MQSMLGVPPFALLFLKFLWGACFVFIYNLFVACKFFSATGGSVQTRVYARACGIITFINDP